MDGLAMVSRPVMTVPNPASDSGKLAHAAQEFEALLMGSLFRALEETFSAAPGETHDAGSDNYNFLGSQALASGLAASGGMGIAKMIMHNLMKNKGAAAPKE